MAKYPALKFGDTLIKLQRAVLPYSKDAHCINELHNLLKGNVQYTTFECDCAELLDSREMFTKQEVLQILNCPMNHKG